MLWNKTINIEEESRGEKVKSVKLQREEEKINLFSKRNLQTDKAVLETSADEAQKQAPQTKAPLKPSTSSDGVTTKPDPVSSQSIDTPTATKTDPVTSLPADIEVSKNDKIKTKSTGKEVLINYTKILILIYCKPYQLL